MLASGRAVAKATLLVGAIGVTACTTDSLLGAPDPDVINPSSVQSAAGANAVRLGALSRLRQVAGGSESTWLFGGLLADEWSTSSTFVQNDETDERSIQLNNSSIQGMLRTIYRVRTAANQAIVLLNKYRPTPVRDVGEMYFARGFAELQLASDFCNGIPLTDGSGDEIKYGDPLTVDQVFRVAIASFDTAITMLTATDTATVTILNATNVARGRALLGINDPVNAGLAVAGIPTTFAYNITYSLTGGTNNIWGQGLSQRRYTVGDSLEGNSRNLLIKNAIPFFSARDPRLPVVYTVNNGKDTVKSQDGLTYSRTTTLYGQLTSTALANGIDARLIEAEAAFRAGNATQMMTILNQLRTDRPPVGSVTPAAGSLPALVDPVNDSLRVNLLFREKAFWTFSRGQRLGDLRRLIRQYGRAADGSTTFPVGTHYRGGTYGADLNLPVTTDELNNPQFKGCLDRKA
jgi:hypothetical protein